MHMSSITADCLAVLALICAALAFQMIRQRRSGKAAGGILLSIGPLIACALLILSFLPWAAFAEEISDQAIAAAHLLQAAYTIMTL
ncbi:hypothetical protein IVA80_33440 [Bradyrhizobium sp. 139]|uniref:hypothetical protein n=1 Tax=Bradyrhizobium sp. 139 TaxID=2782616 RepID=UPI001FF89851|nr:hypothetical protein [Bradyrhizobium sp. 139]MCK1745537.1 hypothetical protein [Bradyrhizobium sp. 139]